MVLGEEVDADADDDADEGRERLRVDFILMSRTGYLLGVDILTAVSEMQSNARDPVPVVDKVLKLVRARTLYVFWSQW